MFTLILPPVSEVKDIVLDLLPVVTTHADPDAIQQSVEQAEKLVLLLNDAAECPTTDAVLKAMLRGMICEMGV